METTNKPASGTTDKDIVVSRLINAQREKVFKAFTLPEQMAQWWGPFGFTNPVCELDVKVGGKWRIEQKGPDGTIYKFSGVYKELVKNERIVWTFTFEGWPDSESTGIIDFEDKNGKTLVTITTRLKSAEDKVNMMKYGASMGQNQAFDRLEEMLSGSNIAQRKMNITRVINAPRELVFEAFTKPEHIKNWWGPNGFTNTISKMEFKNGGEWDLIMHGPDGKDYPNKHFFEEIIENEKIVINHASGPKFKLTFSFIPQGDDKTMLNVRSIFESPELLKQVKETFKADVGLSQNIDKLIDYVSKMKSKNMEATDKFKERKVTIIRIIDAPRQLVFKAWTDPKQMQQWWGPHGFTSSGCKMDLKPGGNWQIRMDAPQMGFTNLWTKGVFKEIVESEKLVLTMNGLEDEETAGLEATNTVTFEDYHGKTKLTLQIVVTNLIPSWEGAFAGMEQGWSQSLEKLTTLLTKTI